MAERIGQFLGNYQLLRLLGRGAFAEVYLAEHRYLEIPAAIKVLHVRMEPETHEQFLHEARTIAHLQHPHIIGVHDFGFQDETPFLVMEYAPNGSLRQRYHEGSVVSLSEIMPSIKQVAAALQYAHEQKYIHCDVKPENMLLGRQQEVLLSDFGLAALARSTASLNTEGTVGTIAYIAPEQIEGHPRAASDQYALAVVIYEWLCGVRPFEGSSTEIVVKQLGAPPPPLREHVPSISAAVEQVVLRALAKDPKQRFASVAAFAAALEEVSQVGLATEAMAPSGRQAAGATQPQVERPWNVPFGRNPFFTGRGLLLERLHAQLSQRQRAALTQSYALSGLGGIGKTQTAIEYAYRYRQDYRAVFWVRADSRETLVADFIAIARLLSLPGQEAPDQLLIVAAVKRWLEQQEGWLLILDNADDLQLLTDFLPSQGNGHLLLTTRAQATGKLAETLSVEKMERSEGMQLVLHRAKLLAHEEPLDTVSIAVRTAAQQLVEELDGLPLALDQAGAYIEETGCSLSEYLQLYERHRLALLQQPSSMASDYPHTVASTWALSFEQVEQQDAAAADLLRLCAYLHPDAIPEEILTEGAAELGPRLSPVAADPLLLNRAIQVLRRYSLVKRDPEAKVLNVHRLVQVVLKENLDELSQRAWAECSIRAMNRAFPEAEYAYVWEWERSERCLPHALLAAQWITQFGFTFPEAARLLHVTGRYLGERVQLTQAEPLLERALSLREQVLGAEHAETARTLNTLAWIYLDLGKYQQAERLLEPALARFERVLGPAHPVIAMTLNRLAAVYLFEGKYAQEEPLLERALAIGEQTLGPEHPDVLEILHSLASLYHFQGKYVQAEPLYQRALTIREHVLGSEHPLVASILHDLAYLYIDQGRYAQAEPLLQRSLTILEQVLGPEQSYTADNLRVLGRLSTLQGKYAQAEALLQRALALHKRLLGPEHDFTNRDLLFLAQLAQATGQESQAESLFQQALVRFEHALGSEHPRVAETLTGLGQLYTQQGHYQQAEPLLERALSIAGQVLGPMHPQTALILDAQGQLALLQGREELAERLLQQALVIQEQALGTAHPEVAQTLHHLAALYEKQGEYAGARAYYEETLALFSDLGLLEGIAMVHFELGLLLFYNQGDALTARSFLEKASRLFRERGNTPGVAVSLLRSAEVALLQGNLAAADVLAEEALGFYRELSYKGGMAEAFFVLARVQARRGNYSTARSCYEDILTLAREADDTRTIPTAFRVEHDRDLRWRPSKNDANLNLPLYVEGLAEVVAAQGEGAWAARLWGAAEAMRNDLNALLPSVFRMEYERAVAVARTQLGEEAFANAEAEGRAMTLEHVLLSLETIPLPTLDGVVLPSASPASLPSPQAGLTPREMEVLRLLAQGLTSAQIAEQLVIGLVTVNSHVRSIYSKLGVTSRSAATRYALEQHLL